MSGLHRGLDLATDQSHGTTAGQTERNTVLGVGGGGGLIGVIVSKLLQ